MLRMRTHSSSPLKDFDEDEEDVAVDFSNAVLYVGALQVVFSVTMTSVVSVLACLLPSTYFVSAIRTLVLSSLVGLVIVRRPFQLGKVHGLTLIFRALQPCVLIYICSLIAEQLVHSCARDPATPSWRRLLSHAMCFLMLVSGYLRARRPLAETDLPFLLTFVALFTISLAPPPAVIFAGPLCSPPTFAAAAERIVRAIIFSLLYSIFVYAAAPPVQSSSEVALCVMRASAASVWVLAAHIMLLPLAVLQAAIVIYTRIFGEEYQLSTFEEHAPLLESPGLVKEAYDVEMPVEMPVTLETPTTNGSAVIAPAFSAFGARGLVDISTATAGEADFARVAARLEAEET